MKARDVFSSVEGVNNARTMLTAFFNTLIMRRAGAPEGAGPSCVEAQGGKHMSFAPDR